MAKVRKLVRLQVGGEHTVRLEGLLPAGYVWEPEIQGDQDVAEIERSAPAPGGGAVGAGGEEVFTIKAKRAGKTTIRLAQRRPWETTDEPVNEHVVDLEVDN